MALPSDPERLLWQAARFQMSERRCGSWAASSLVSSSPTSSLVLSHFVNCEQKTLVDWTLVLAQHFRGCLPSRLGEDGQLPSGKSMVVFATCVFVFASMEIGKQRIRSMALKGRNVIKVRGDPSLLWGT